MVAFDLSGKKIIVTGASSGIGRQVAIECSNLGATVLLLGRDKQRLMESQNLMKNSYLHEIFQLDYSAESIEWDEVAQQIQLKIGVVDGIVHCAGITSTLPFNSINDRKLDEIFKINVNAPLLLTKVLSKKGILNQEGASIIFIASVMSTVGEVAKTLYSATKGALVGAVKSMALEFARKNIRVNAISPGVILTPMVQNGVYAQDPENLDRVTKMHPLGLGSPTDVANACIYLLSDGGRWVTGTNLILDGGYSAH